MLTLTSQHLRPALLYRRCCQAFVSVLVLLVVTSASAAAVNATALSCNCSPRLNLLHDLYTATSGASWIHPWNFSAPDAPCSFRGVMCEEASADITLLNVSNQGLVGTLPASLGSLATLTTFDASMNKLSGSLPSTLSNWSHMKTFVIGNNSLSGTIPPELSLWGSSIETFAVGLNVLVGSLPTVLSEWTSIRVIDVSNNKLSGTLPPQFSALITLTDFVAGNNSLSGTLPVAFQSLTKILNFYVDSNPKIEGTLPPEYSAWTALRIFYAQFAAISGTLPSSYASWGATLKQFQVYSARLTGTLPAVYSRWRVLDQLVVHNNSLSGTLPEEYGPLNIASYISLRNNHFTGTIPDSWGGMTDLRHLHLASNSLTGTIPQSIMNIQFLTIISVGFNFLSGRVPDPQVPNPALPALLFLIDVQNNPQITATLPFAKQQAWTTCGTAIPCTVTVLPFKVCLPKDFDFYRLLDLPNSQAFLTEFMFDCLHPPTTPAPSPLPQAQITKTLSLTTLDVGTKIASASAFSNYRSPLSAPSALVAAFCIADPVTGVGLVALGAGRCAPEALRGTTTYGQLLLSPFYSFGAHVAVLGNIGLCLGFLLLHRGVVLLKTNRGPSSGPLRYPHVSVLLTFYFARGIAFYGGQSFVAVGVNDDAATMTTTSSPLNLVSGVCSVLFLLVVAIAVVRLERSGVLRSFVFQRYRLAALRRLPWVPSYALPQGRWGPDAMRLQYAALRGPVAGVRRTDERLAMLTLVVGVASALIIGAVPGTTGGCVTQAILQSLLLGGAAVFVGMFQPMRILLSGWLLCATWTVQTLLNICVVVARVSDSKAAMDASAILATLHSIIGVVQLLHRLVVMYWERRVNPKTDFIVATTTTTGCVGDDKTNKSTHIDVKSKRRANEGSVSGSTTVLGVEWLSLDADEITQQHGHSSCGGPIASIQRERLKRLISSICDPREIVRKEAGSW